MLNNDPRVDPRWCCFLLFVCVLFFLATGKSGAADKNKQTRVETTSIKHKKRQPHCGLYCLYTAMKLAGKEMDFKELVKPEYLSSRKGSSIAELKQAAKDNGFFAESVAKLNSRILMESPHPVILHVKSSADSKEYGHFELFLGTENGRAKLFNPPEPVKLVPFYELTPRWDGTGLLVSAKPIDLAAILAPARKKLLLYAIIGVAIVLGLHWARQRWLCSAGILSRPRLFRLSAAQGAGLAFSALLVGMLYHFANDAGFLANANATTSIQQAHEIEFIPKVTKTKARKLLNTDTVFIDARLARDFQTDHIEGAVSIPVDADDTQRKEATAGIAKDAGIIIYCQSSGCPYAGKVAKKLKADGFSNISIFKGGWNQWQMENN